MTLILLALVPSLVVAQGEKGSAKPDTLELEKKIKENPDDAAAFNKYMTQTIQALLPAIDSNPDKAEAMLKKMDEFLAVLEPETPAGKQLLARAKRASTSLTSRIKMARTTFEDLERELTEEPDNMEVLSMLVGKASNSAAGLARTEPKKAEEIIAKAKKILKDAREKTEKEETQKAIDNMLERSFRQLDAMVASGKKLLELIGKDATEMNVDGWVNGEALSAKDLKGKVVLLDFWAVWCGPCIATFPHLNEWNEKYSDKGLVIVGVTKYYNYAWDEEKNRAMRSQEKVTPEDENKMLEKFAASHNLKHRFAIQSSGELSKYYGVTGIPHAVVIDQQGKIRMIRVGSGEKNAKDIEGLLEELLN